MTIYYVGIGGNDGNAGTSWAARKLTLNGAEDIPVVAGDTVYVGPGVYRELLTVDVSGGAGTPIVYVADVTGEHTDGVGGVVRVTGSDDDQTVTRANCVTATTKVYRTFRGFYCDTVSNTAMNLLNNCANWVIEDCTFQGIAVSAVRVAGATATGHIIRRCLILGTSGYSIHFTHTSSVDNAGHLVENCIIINPKTRGVGLSRVGGATVRNCIFICSVGVQVDAVLTAGQTENVNNCIFYCCNTGVQGTALGEITENYNIFHLNATDRTNTDVGANSLAYPPLFAMPLLHAGASQASGFEFPWVFGALSPSSAVRAITGAGEATEDLFGIPRPATAAKNSWGAVQFQQMVRDTATTRGSSTASLELSDAGRHQVFVPISAVSTTIKVYVYREANYAGTNPQMIVKQPGQADTTVTDTEAAAQWNLLTATLTPAANPGYVVVELVSRNTAAAGSYAVYFDDLNVT